MIGGNVEEALDFYVKMCSLSVTAESLASLGLLLANDGVDPDPHLPVDNREQTAADAAL